ncbi:MAG: tetratricopeptide repeat protein [Phycisphaerae bacterium]
MKDLKRTISIAAVMVLAACETPTFAQRRREITDPRDETRLVQPTRRRINRQQPLNSQLYVTGQVSGLAAFRGDVPYGAPDAFRDSVPSAGLSSFRRQSVGLPDIRSGRVFNTSVYRDPSTTVTTAGQVLEDARVRSRRDTYDQDRRLRSSLADELYVDATAGYRPLTAMEQEPSGQRRQFQLLPEQYSPTGRQYSERASAFGIDSGAMFGLIRREQREELIQQLQTTGPEGAYRPFGARLDDRVVMRNEAFTGQTGPHYERDTEQQPLAEEDRAFVLPPEGEDVYVDLLLAMRDRLQAAGEGRYDSAREAETLRRGDRRGTDGDPEAIVQARPGRPVVVRGLAGEGEDLFNRYMSEAEQNLREGKYYDARNSYEMARLVDDENPLVWVGLALSTYAAGEPAAAGFYLHRSMELFPPIMETRFELTRMAPEQRMREMLGILGRRLRDDQDTQLLMLATFMHLNLGERQQAREYAERLEAAAAGDAVARAYAEYVLSGRRPADDAQPE